MHEEKREVPGRGVKFWRDQISKSLEARGVHENWWRANLKAYAPQPGDDPDGYGSTVNTNRDFTLVERKKSDLFYQRPEVTLQPSPLLDGPITSPEGQQLTGQDGQPIGQHAALQSHQEILNEKLGPDGIRATRMVHQTLFDVLGVSGIGFTKMGYESTTVEVDQPDPAWQPDPMLPPEAQKPPTIKVPVPVAERCFWEYFSPLKAVIPHDFRSTDWDAAPFLGYQFELPLTETNRQRYSLPPEFKGSPSAKPQYFDHGAGEQNREGVFSGTELWYRSSLFRDDIKHPDHLTQLVIVDGIDEPVIEKDSPYQTLDDRGKLTPDSLIGFPIHPLNMRTLTDSSYPPSDSTMIRPLVNELNRFREQMVEYRDAQTLRWMYNTDVLPKEALQKIVRAPIGGMIAVPAEAFHGEGAIKELPHGSMPRESFTSNDYIDNDIARTTAIDSAGAGVQSTKATTATEQQIIASNVNARLDWERGIVLEWYIKGVTKFSSLLQRYLSAEKATAIVGQQRAAIWDAWRRVVPATLAFTALPDAALRTDQATDRKQAQDLYSFLANDPFVNRGELLTQLLRKFHLDPSKVVQQPPPPKPEPPKLSLTFKGDDLVGPQAPIVLEVLQQLGVQISAAAIQLSQQALASAQEVEAAQQAEQAATKHGGKTANAEPLSKHAADATGGMQGTGAPAAMGGGGGFLG